MFVLHPFAPSSIAQWLEHANNRLQLRGQWRLLTAFPRQPLIVFKVPATLFASQTSMHRRYSRHTGKRVCVYQNLD